MKKIVASILLLFFLSSSQPMIASAASNEKPAFTPYDVIAGINAYREANGLHALTANDTLMQLAQGHSDYQASIGTITHSGPGGSRPKDRAYAAGYGGGNFIYLSEIIYGGSNATYQSAIEWWKNSTVHNTEMLRDNIYEIGAGVTTDGGWTYFTCELGTVTSWAAPADAGSSSGSSADDEDTSPPVVIAVPVVIATPQEDGSVVHIVRTGQALWTIAAIYEVALDELLANNGMTRNSIVKPGDEIIVVPAAPPTALPTKTPFSSLLPTQTSQIPLQNTNQPKPTLVSETDKNEESQGTAIGDAVSSENPINPNVKRFIIGAFIILVLVIGGSAFFQKQEAPPVEEDDLVR